MKRKTKNIILIICLMLMIILTGLTVYFAHNSMTSPVSNEKNMSENNNGGTPPDMPNNNSSSDNQSDNGRPSTPSDNANSTTPPDKPDNDSSSDNQSDNGQPSMPSDNANSTTPPDKPDNDTSSTTTPPEKPDGDTGGNNGNMTPPSNNESSTNKSIEIPSNDSTSLDISYYILFGIEGLIIAYLIMYLIMSNFNKKTLKETFNSKDKIFIMILSCIIITTLITVGDIIITNKISTNNIPNNNLQDNTTYTAVTSITSDSDINNQEYTSSNADENALLVSGDITVSLSSSTVMKAGDSDGGDSTSFYGNNSGILAKDGATLNLDNVTVTTDATGANGVFSYGGSATTNNSTSDGTTINISNSKITTSKDNSGGIMVTGGGILNATNLNITTSGTSSASIRSDRGGGTMLVNGGTYTTTGQGSPSIYSTADITVKNATLIAKASEGVVIEGKNSVTLDNVTLTDSNTKLNGQSTTYKNIFLYQSMSGDASTGTSNFSASNSKITTNKGDTLYVTNTTASISLENNTIVNNDSTGYFLRIQKDSWGNSGSNGGDVTLNLTNQDVTGNIYVDSISTLEINMTESSTFKGYINTNNTAKSITLNLDKTSSISLTSDTYVTKLNDKDTTYSNINFNGYKLYVNGVAIN